jgi:hypothetical protein
MIKALDDVLTICLDNIVAAAGEGGCLGVWDTNKGFSHAIQLNIEARIKALVAIPPINRIILVVLLSVIFFFFFFFLVPIFFSKG